ncbi:uncharacterized protein Smp_202050 [Schistosoma mansoni]|uniref:uncharacterized protein n=1 Tax=Schistosoma mansoni TaxID=6183 RepID=UPI00022DC415|nr:uncharacterized protein Smp_202050 [Schistosoma mansoni]|eukprot:XP_018650993.1 uncharacterized protein Smp_202050 [Schistosoma mansoni]
MIFVPKITSCRTNILTLIDHIEIIKKHTITLSYYALWLQCDFTNEFSSALGTRECNTDYYLIYHSWKYQE